MKFNIDDYKGKYAMHCKTEEEAKDFCKFLDSIGQRWKSGTSYAEETYYDNYKDKTCYDFNDGEYTDISFFNENNYTILEWSDFMNKEFTKSDLKNGDVIKRRNGEVEIVCVETETLISKDEHDFDNLREIEMDLTYETSALPEYDIIAVRRPTAPSECRFDAFDEKLGQLVFEREEVEEMTLEEVCEALGKKIKIVKSKGCT